MAIPFWVLMFIAKVEAVPLGRTAGVKDAVAPEGRPEAARVMPLLRLP